MNAAQRSARLLLNGHVTEKELANYDKLIGRPIPGAYVGMKRMDLFWLRKDMADAEKKGAKQS